MKPRHGRCQGRSGLLAISNDDRRQFCSRSARCSSERAFREPSLPSDGLYICFYGSCLRTAAVIEQTLIQAYLYQSMVAADMLIHVQGSNPIASISYRVPSSDSQDEADTAEILSTGGGKQHFNIKLPFFSETFPPNVLVFIVFSGADKL